MADKRNQQDQSNRSSSNRDRQEQNKTTSDRDVNVENPQQGDQWDNYRTRELSSQSQPGNTSTTGNNQSGTEGMSE